MKKIGILDYGLGNLASIKNSITYIGSNPILSSNFDDFEKCDSLIIPGVGSFFRGMTNIHSAKLDQKLSLYTSNNRPVLGICLGYQMLNQSGTEHGITEGLKYLNGEVKRLNVPEGTLLPHIGWQRINVQLPNPLTKGIENELFYFVHSYGVYMSNASQIFATTGYAETQFVSIGGNNNIYGVQFHPEKSRDAGLQLLKNFIGINS